MGNSIVQSYTKKALPSKELNVPGIYSEDLEQRVSVIHTLLLKTKDTVF